MGVDIHFLSTLCRPDGQYVLCHIPPIALGLPCSTCIIPGFEKMFLFTHREKQCSIYSLYLALPSLYAGCSSVPQESRKSIVVAALYEPCLIRQPVPFTMLYLLFLLLGLLFRTLAPSSTCKDSPKRLSTRSASLLSLLILRHSRYAPYGCLHSTAS